VETDQCNTVTELYKPVIFLRSARSYLVWTRTYNLQPSNLQTEVRRYVYYNKINVCMKFDTWLSLQTSTIPQVLPDREHGVPARQQTHAKVIDRECKLRNEQEINDVIVDT
jgi:hypothetical protein